MISRRPRGRPSPSTKRPSPNRSPIRAFAKLSVYAIKYRYQSFIFGLVVIFSLIAAGVTQLSTFVIPAPFLASWDCQAVYIGGKLVTPTNIADVNAAITDLRDREKKFREAATAKKPGKVADLAEAVSLLGQSALDAYRDKAQEVAAVFTAETQKTVPASGLDPSID